MESEGYNWRHGRCRLITKSISGRSASRLKKMALPMAPLLAPEPGHLADGQEIVVVSMPHCLWMETRLWPCC